MAADLSSTHFELFGLRQALRALEGRVADEVFFAFERLKPFAEALQHQVVRGVETRGKGLLIHFEGDLSIYSHNQLYGRWVVRDAYRFPETTRQLRLAIHNAHKSALLYSASEIDVLTPEQQEYLNSWREGTV